MPGDRPGLGCIDDAAPEQVPVVGRERVHLPPVRVKRDGEVLAVFHPEVPVEPPLEIGGLLLEAIGEGGVLPDLPGQPGTPDLGVVCVALQLAGRPGEARQVWKDTALADRLEREAADLKRRFNRDFWVEDGQYFAVALDTDGRQVDSLTSNNGHLLWSGIVEPAKAAAVARHLLGPRLFSGWGVRTLAEGESRYNPIGYHVGTVWPFDNSFIAWGLRRYGFKEQAARIVAGMLQAAEVFDGRLPEAFGGYPRSDTKYPVRYPTACSPQAWSTGAPLLLLRVGLGLEPHGENLIVDPALPRWIGHLQLLDLPGRWDRIDAFGRGRVDTDRSAPR